MGATPRPPTNKGAEFVAQGIDGAAIGAGDSRRQELLRAALDVIAERGFSDTRIADVADRAGTSPALVIYYFRTKDNLLTEAVRLAEDLWYDFGYERMALEAKTHGDRRRQAAAYRQVLYGSTTSRRRPLLGNSGSR